MKKILLYTGLAATASVLGGTSAKAQTTTPPYVVVERVGDGSAALTSAGTAVFLDEYSLTGTLLSSYEMPTTGTTTLVDSGTAGSDGEINTSADGNYLLVPGYDTTVGTAGVTGSASTAIPREVATLSGTGTLVQTTLNNFSANNIRSVASPDGSTLFTSGGNSGIVSLTSGTSGTPGTVITTGSLNNRSLTFANNQLYLSTASGSTLRIATVGTAPTSATATGQTVAEVAGIPVGTTATTPVNAPYGFVVANLAANGDTIYVADNGTGTIEKFSFSTANSMFTLTGTAALAGVTGLTGRTVGGTEQLFATTPTGLYSLTDASGAGGTLASTVNLIAAAGTNEAFRGDTLFTSVVPTNVPEPSTYVLLVAGSLGLLAMARRGVRRARA